MPLYRHLPNELAAQMARVATMSIPQFRNYQTPAPAPLPPSPPAPPAQAYPHIPEELATRMATLHAIPAMPQ